MEIDYCTPKPGLYDQYGTVRTLTMEEEYCTPTTRHWLLWCYENMNNGSGVLYPQNRTLVTMELWMNYGKDNMKNYCALSRHKHVTPGTRWVAPPDNTT